MLFETAPQPGQRSRGNVGKKRFPAVCPECMDHTVAAAGNHQRRSVSIGLSERIVSGTGMKIGRRSDVHRRTVSQISEDTVPPSGFSTRVTLVGVVSPGPVHDRIAKR